MSEKMRGAALAEKLLAQATDDEAKEPIGR